MIAIAELNTLFYGWLEPGTQPPQTFGWVGRSTVKGDIDSDIVPPLI